MLSGFELYPRWVPLKYFKLQVKTINCMNSIENAGNELKKQPK